ncbi:Putative F-box protein [Glycine soja]|nr:Putative F-box protein [Glycine soja]
MNRMATLPPPTLPDDLIVNILSRLRVRSLLRSKCVCKSWLSLISDPQFVKSHSGLAEATPTHLLLKSSNNPQFNCIDIEASLHDDGDSTKVIFNIPPPSSASGPVSRVDIVGSCRGFILLAYVYANFFYFVIWNPPTGFHKRIDNVSSTDDCVERVFRIGYDNFALLFGIGYDSSTDDYVVVIVTVSLPLPLRITIQSRVLLNGSLHWLVVKSDGNRCLVIAFDVTERISFRSFQCQKVEALLRGYCAVTHFDLKYFRKFRDLRYLGHIKQLRLRQFWDFRMLKVFGNSETLGSSGTSGISGTLGSYGFGNSGTLGTFGGGGSSGLGSCGTSGFDNGDSRRLCAPTTVV